MSEVAKSTQEGPVYCKEVMKLVGDFWTVRIVEALEPQDLRFCALERALQDSNPATLTNRLKKLESYGILARRTSEGDTLYTLTRSGVRLAPILRELRAVATELSV